MRSPSGRFLQGAWLLTSLFLHTVHANAAGPITALRFHPDGTQLITARSGELQVLDWPRGEVLRTIPVEMDYLHDIRFLPGESGRVVVVGGSPGEFGAIAVVDLAGARVLASTSHGTDVLMVASCDLDHHCVTGSMTNELTSWKIELPKPGSHDEHVDLRPASPAFPPGHSKPILSVTYTPDYRQIVSAGVDHTLRVWNAADGQLVSRLDHHTGSVRSLTVRPGAHAPSMVASTSADHTVRLWQPSRGRMVRFVRLQDEPTVATWSKDGDWLLVGFTNGYVRIIDPETATVAAEAQVCHEWIHAIDSSPATNWEFVVAGQKVHPVTARWEPFLDSSPVD